MNRTIFGVPLWLVLLAVAGGGGYYLYDQRKKAAAASSAAAASAAQASAANTAAGSSSAAGTPTSMDPQLVAYQAGESSGVAAYSAGVTTGISLVDSIMSLFPGGATEQTQANQAATTATAPKSTPTAATTSAPQLVQSPQAGGYTYIASWAMAKALAAEGVQLYMGIQEPANAGGGWQMIPTPKNFQGVPSGTPMYTWTGVPSSGTTTAATQGAAA